MVPSHMIEIICHPIFPELRETQLRKNGANIPGEMLKLLGVAATLAVTASGPCRARICDMKMQHMNARFILLDPRTRPLPGATAYSCHGNMRSPPCVTEIR